MERAVSKVGRARKFGMIGVVATGELGEFGNKPRFADAGLPGNHNDLPMPFFRLAPRFEQNLDLDFATNHWCGRCDHIREV